MYLTLSMYTAVTQFTHMNLVYKMIHLHVLHHMATANHTRWKNMLKVAAIMSPSVHYFVRRRRATPPLVL